MVQTPPLIYKYAFNVTSEKPWHKNTNIFDNFITLPVVRIQRQSLGLVQVPVNKDSVREACGGTGHCQRLHGYPVEETVTPVNIVRQSIHSNLAHPVRLSLVHRGYCEGLVVPYAVITYLKYPSLRGEIQRPLRTRCYTRDPCFNRR